MSDNYHFIQLFLGLIENQSKVNLKWINNKLVFAMPKALGVMGWFVNLIATGILIYALINYNIENYVAQLSIISALALFGLCLIRYSNHKIEITKNEIIATTIWGRKKSIEWMDFKSYNYTFNGLVVISDTNKFVCSGHLKGFDFLGREITKFVEEAKKKIEKEERKQRRKEFKNMRKEKLDD